MRAVETIGTAGAMRSGTRFRLVPRSLPRDARSMPLPKSLPSIVLGIAFVLLATSLATAQTSPRDIRVIAAPTTVWS